jgi:hypothetical protein
MKTPNLTVTLPKIAAATAAALAITATVLASPALAQWPDPSWLIQVV